MLSTNKVYTVSRSGLRSITTGTNKEMVYDKIFKLIEDDTIQTIVLTDIENKLTIFKRDGSVMISEIHNPVPVLRRFIFEYKLKNGDGKYE